MYSEKESKKEKFLFQFFYFSLAFNHVDNTLLFTILRLLNLSDDTIRFLHSFLTNRSFTLDDANPGICSCGVGQGAGPGGNLFLLIVNQLFNPVRPARLSFFTDDSQALIHCRITEIPETIQKINSDIQQMVKWSQEVGLTLNPSKTQNTIIGSNFNLRKF